MFVGCVALATSCDLTENVQVKADKSMIFGSKSGLELYSNSFYKALPTLKNGFMQDKMCDVGAVSNTDTFIKQGAYTLSARLLHKQELALPAPQGGVMERSIKESLCCQAAYCLKKNGVTLLDIESPLASFEYEHGKGY